MEYLLDTADITLIRKYADYLPIAGVTTNPSIVKQQGNINFFEHMKAIRNIIGSGTLHIQVVATDADSMLRDADALLHHVDEQVYIKIPVTLDGLKAIRNLSRNGHHVTATAVYSVTQGLLAMEAGAQYIAPYYNRMEGLNMDPEHTIAAMAKMIAQYRYPTSIVAASFKNIGQVNKAFLAGAHAATMDPCLLVAALDMPEITKAVDDFCSDWRSIYGDTPIAGL